MFRDRIIDSAKIKKMSALFWHWHLDEILVFLLCSLLAGYFFINRGPECRIFLHAPNGVYLTLGGNEPGNSQSRYIEGNKITVNFRLRYTEPLDQLWIKFKQQATKNPATLVAIVFSNDKKTVLFRNTNFISENGKTSFPSTFLNTQDGLQCQGKIGSFSPFTMALVKPSHGPYQSLTGMAMPFDNWVLLLIFTMLEAVAFILAINYRRILKNLKKPLRLRHVGFKITVVVITLLSILIFSFFFKQNHGKLYFDEVDYLCLATSFNHNSPDIGHFPELFNFRTYGYPLFLAVNIAIAERFFVADFPLHVRTSILVVMVSYLLFLAASYVLLALLLRLPLSWGYAVAAWAGIILNPWVIQASTLMLSDLLAAILVMLGFSWLILLRDRSCAHVCWQIVFLALAVMIRPVMLIFVPIFAIVYGCICLREKCSWQQFIRPILPGCALLLLIFMPQMCINSVLCPEVKFPIVLELGKDHWDASPKYLKYSTDPINKRRGSHIAYFENPVYAAGNYRSRKEFLLQQPIQFVIWSFAHLPSVIDQGELNSFDTYIRPRPAWLVRGTLFIYYLYWLAAFIAPVFWIFRRKSREEIFTGIMFLLPLIGYTGVIMNTQIESRFVYPMLFLLPSLVAMGLRHTGNFLCSGKTIPRILLMLVLIGVWSCGWFFFHSWLDGLVLK